MSLGLITKRPRHVKILRSTWKFEVNGIEYTITVTYPPTYVKRSLLRPSKDDVIKPYQTKLDMFF